MGLGSDCRAFVRRVNETALDWCRPQADPELLAVAHEILAEREANGDKAPSENELLETIAERVKGKEKNR